MRKGAVLAGGGTGLEVSRGVLPALPLPRTQAQPGTAAGTLGALPVGIANLSTEKRGCPRGAKGSLRVATAASAAVGARRAGGGLGRNCNYGSKQR